MKKILLTLICLCTLSLAMAQEEGKKKVEIKKEAKVEMINGEKVLTIVTTTNGQQETETYKGDDVDKKLAEMDAEAAKAQEEMKNDPNRKVIVKKEKSEGKKNSTEIKKEVKVEEENGEMTLTILTTENGQVKEEVYKGEAAKKKLKELEAEQH